MQRYFLCWMQPLSLYYIWGTLELSLCPCRFMGARKKKDQHLIRERTEILQDKVTEILVCSTTLSTSIHRPSLLYAYRRSLFLCLHLFITRTLCAILIKEDVTMLTKERTSFTNAIQSLICFSTLEIFKNRMNVF